MEVSPSISVIVPMYLAEDWLDRCVESILTQTVDDIELILVDDASPDGCARLAALWAQRDGRVRTTATEGLGAGGARNAGLGIARGRYVAFVDADDWIDSDHLERLLRAADEHGTDIACTGMAEMRGGHEARLWELPQAGSVLEGADELFGLRRSFFGALPEQLRKDPIPLGISGSILSREFLLSEDLSFPSGHGEDIRFNIRALKRARRVAVLPGCSYRYFKDNALSTTSMIRPGLFEEVYAFLTELRLMAEEEDPAYREECLLRAERSVLDWTRGLLDSVQAQPVPFAVKRAEARCLLSEPLLVEVCAGYPWRRLPFMHRAYFALLKSRSAAGLLAAGKIRKLLLG